MSADLRQVRLLLLDDNLEAMGYLADAIRERGGAVTQVANRREAREASSGEYDGIIVDLMFPPGAEIPGEDTDSGFRAGAYIYFRDIVERQPDTPFIVLTAVDSTTSVFRDAIARLRECRGYRGALEKPVSLGEILKLLLGDRE